MRRTRLQNKKILQEEQNDQRETQLVIALLNFIDLNDFGETACKNFGKVCGLKKNLCKDRESEAYLKQCKINSEFRDKVRRYCDPRSRDDAIKAFGLIGKWDTKDVTDMSNLFQYKHYFNETLNKWDTSKVTNMSGMFENAHAFNNGGEALTFETGNVKDMSKMFALAWTFNQPLTTFKTQTVTNMSNMFNDAKAFNQSLNFNTQNVTDMSDMFCHAKVFNQPLTTFKTKNVTNMSGMFSRAKKFNQSLNFNTQKVTNMSYMFQMAKQFNNGGVLLKLHIKTDTNTYRMFEYTLFATNEQKIFNVMSLRDMYYDTHYNTIMYLRKT